MGDAIYQTALLCYLLWLGVERRFMANERRHIFQTQSYVSLNNNIYVSQMYRLFQ